jgi:ABC-type dipeptide/oligopeptide/nickel transport system permease component
MAKFIIRRVLLMLLTMLIVSVAVFLITEAAPGNVARNVLGIHITPEQEASFLAQTGLDRPIYQRYFFWLLGSDWLAAKRVGLQVKEITTEDGFKEWWAVDEDGTLVRWKLEGNDLIARRRQPDGQVEEVVDNGRWQVKDPAVEIERLQALRDQVLQNQQLTDTDRQAILQQLDIILEILSQKGQSQEQLAAALAAPEAALDKLIDPEVARQKEALAEAADNFAKEPLLQAVAAYQALSSPSADQLKTNELRSMSRQLGQAAHSVQDYNPGLADQLQQAADNLEAGEPAAARQILDNDIADLRQLTGSLNSFVDALKAEDYEGAASVLRSLSDPSQTALQGDQLKALPGLIKSASQALKDANADLSESLLQAAESLDAGDTQAARQSLSQAADTLAETGHIINRSDAAGQARVTRTFWGVDTQNHAVDWEKGAGGKQVWVFIVGTGWKAFAGGPVEYIPLQKGLLRGDPGVSLRTGRPVADLLFIRLRNSLVLAGIAFIIVMPLALVLGLIAGLNEGKLLDRTLSIGGMMFSVTPEFATGIFLILIFAFWLKVVPGATVFGEKAPWQRPDMLVLPILTLTLIELGYVLRITRASMVDVMKAPYIRTAFLKGLPYWRIVIKHAVRNALMAPITVIMLHVNWLLGGIVVVEVIFGYPGLGSYLLDSALFKDFNAIEAGAMVLVTVAVATQLIADIIYTFLNPRIRYA